MAMEAKIMLIGAIFGACLGGGSILLGIGTRSWPVGVGAFLCVAPLNLAAMITIFHVHLL